jgi:hypothetical protein
MNRVVTVAVTFVLGACPALAALQQNPAAAPGSAVTRPDFSGRWTSDPDPAAAGPGARGAAGNRGATPGLVGGRGDMGSGWGATIAITQDAIRLTVEYAFFGRGDMQPPLRFVYALDGSQTKNAVLMGRGLQEQTARTAWDSNRLVITTTHAFSDPTSGKPMTTEVTQVLSLESPTALVVETTRSGALGGPASSTRTIYRKI